MNTYFWDGRALIFRSRPLQQRAPIEPLATLRPPPRRPGRLPLLAVRQPALERHRLQPRAPRRCRTRSVAFEEVKRLLPQVCYRVGIDMEPINPEPAGWEFLNRVIAAIATGSHGLGFNVYTGAPIR